MFETRDGMILTLGDGRQVFVSSLSPRLIETLSELNDGKANLPSIDFRGYVILDGNITGESVAVPMKDILSPVPK